MDNQEIERLILRFATSYPARTKVFSDVVGGAPTADVYAACRRLVAAGKLVPHYGPSGRRVTAYSLAKEIPPLDAVRIDVVVRDVLDEVDKRGGLEYLRAIGRRELDDAQAAAIQLLHDSAPISTIDTDIYGVEMYSPFDLDSWRTPPAPSAAAPERGLLWRIAARLGLVR